MTALAGVDARALEVRLLLDLVSFELQRLELPAGTPVGVSAAAPELLEGLRDRLWPEHDVVAGGSRALAVHLLDLEERGAPETFPADRLVLAFRNAWSHKRLIGSDWRGLAYPRLERRVGREHRIESSRGVMTPGTLGGIALAGAANGAGRFGVGFWVADRAALAPSTTRWIRHLCPYGLITARRRS